MSGIKTIGQITNYKPVAQCGMEELAYRQINLKASGGVNFSRNPDGDQKTIARQAVLDLFSYERWGNRHLNILTMPGVFWRFERKLFAQRDPGWTNHRKPRNTYVTGVENDRSIYFVAVTEMPGLQTPGGIVKPTKKHGLAEMGVKTKYASFFFANVDDFISNAWVPAEHERIGWDAAWLDYTGPMSNERMTKIVKFYDLYIRDTLVITALKARWNRDTARSIERAGGHNKWLAKRLPGEVLLDMEYFDTSPMAQFAVRKVPHG